MSRSNSRLLATSLVIAAVITGACGRRPPPLPPPPVATHPPATETRTGSTAPDPPSVLVPTLDVRIEPPSIKRGESALLIWQAQHSDRVTIDHNIGVVDTAGKIKFFPDETTTYRAVAEGAGGRTEKIVTVDVSVGPGRVSEEDLLQGSVEEQFEQSVKPIFFSFDKATLGSEAKEDLEGNVRWLQREENSHLRFVLEGHCDERGSEEYNLALGDIRAQVVRSYLLEQGVDPSRITAISLGEERPFDSRRTEEAWTLNRRVQFVLVKGS